MFNVQCPKITFTTKLFRYFYELSVVVNIGMKRLLIKITDWMLNFGSKDSTFI